jgi:hypothetical protein
MRRITLTTLLSLGIISCGIGCPGNNSDFKKTSELKKAPPVHEHGHGAKGPHGGGLIELGAEEYHAEIVVDHDAHAVRVYVLGKEALKLKAAPQKTDGEGKSSVFELIDDGVVHTLMDAKAIHGKLQVSIGGKPFTGEIDYHIDGSAHDHKDEKGHADHKDTDHKDEAAKPDAAKKEDSDKPAEAAKDSEPKK